MEKNKKNQQNQGLTDKAVLLIKNHKKAVIISLACVVALGAIIGGVQTYQQKKYQKLWSDFFLAQLAIEKSKDNIDLSALETFE